MPTASSTRATRSRCACLTGRTSVSNRSSGRETQTPPDHRSAPTGQPRLYRPCAAAWRRQSAPPPDHASPMLVQQLDPLFALVRDTFSGESGRMLATLAVLILGA